MKNILLAFVIIIGLTNFSYGQTQISDSVFVRLNHVSSDKLFFNLQNGKITLVNVDIKNKYKHFLGFISSYFDSDLVLKEKAKIDSKKVVEYKTYNEMLNKDFYNIYFHYHTYFIISEDKLNYLVLEVRPILPPELNKQ